MKKIQFLGLVGWLLVFVGSCSSTSGTTREASPFEGEWIIEAPHTQYPNQIIQTKFTFTGNTFIQASDAGITGVFQNLLKGVFTYTPVMIRLDTTHMGTPKGGWIKDSFQIMPTMLYGYEFDNNGNLFFTNESGTYPVIKQ